MKIIDQLKKLKGTSIGARLSSAGVNTLLDEIKSFEHDLRDTSLMASNWLQVSKVEKNRADVIEEENKQLKNSIAELNRDNQNLRDKIAGLEMALAKPQNNFTVMYNNPRTGSLCCPKALQAEISQLMSEIECSNGDFRQLKIIHENLQFSINEFIPCVRVFVNESADCVINSAKITGVMLNRQEFIDKSLSDSPLGKIRDSLRKFVGKLPF